MSFGEMTIPPFWATVLLIGFLGTLYGTFHHWLVVRGFDEGYEGFLTIPAGLLALAGVWRLYDLKTALVVLALLLAAAMPCIIGNTARYMVKRRRETLTREANALGELLLNREEVSSG